MKLVTLSSNRLIWSATGLAIILGALALTLAVVEETSQGEEKQAKEKKSGAGSLPPLIIDRNAPLLLEDPPKEAGGSAKPYLRINNSCYVCHDNYTTELLSVVHAKEEIGCADCHGDSLEHRNDEDNITPPDIMYPAAKIDAMCQECHDSHDAPARDVLKTWQERCPEKTDFDTVVCTDCHGQHRLDKRSVRWDKETGDLLVEADDKQAEESSENR